MGKKTLIPEEKWEGLRHAMEEAAGTRKTSKSTGLLPPAAEGEAAGGAGKEARRDGGRKRKGKGKGEGKEEKEGEEEKEREEGERKKEEER